MLVVEGLTAAYGARRILNGLSIPAFKAGQMTAIVGPNAAGKSTLLKAVAGIVAYKGSIRLRDTALETMPRRRRAALIGFMPQMTPTRSDLTVLEATINVAAMVEGRRQAGDVAGRVLALLAELGIEQLALAPLERLSGGQRQMASFAQALIFSPDVLLLDEPTSALDLGHQIRVMSVARRMAQQGKVVLTALHDLPLAAKYADRIVVLHEGRMAASGTPLEVLTPELLKTVYGVVAQVVHTEGQGLYLEIESELPPGERRIRSGGLD